MTEMPHGPEQAAPEPEIKDRPQPTREIEEKYLLAGEQDFKNLDARLRSMGSYLAYAAYETSYIYPSLAAEQLRHVAEKLRDQSVREQIAGIPADAKVSMNLKEKKNREDGRWASLSIKASGDDPLHDIDRIEIDIPEAGHYADDLASEFGLPEPDTIWQAKPRRRFQMDPRLYGPNTYVDLIAGTGYGYSAEIEADSPETIAEIEVALGGLVAMTPAQKRAGYAAYKAAGFSSGHEHDARDLVFSREQWDRIGELAGEMPVSNQVV